MLQGNKRKILPKVVILFLLTAMVIVIAWTTGPFYYHFAERRLVTLYSFFQLLAVAYVSFLTCRILEKEGSLSWRKNPSARPFFIAAAGFLFLGFDEILSIHENIDKFIHLLFRIKETALTDHIDDFILLAYGIIAAFFIKDFVKEFKKHPYMVGLIIGGFALFFIMFFLDFISNNIETFTHFFFKGMSYGDLRYRQDIFRMAEDSIKLLGEASFLSAFTAAFVDIKIRK